MDRCAAFNRCVVWLVAIALVSACTTTRQIELTGSRPLTDQVEAGDRVEIEKKDGELLKFKISEVSQEGLRGDDIFVPAADIDRIRVLEDSDVVASVGSIVLWAVIVGLVFWQASGLDQIHIER
jgi:hypothetical protein